MKLTTKAFENTTITDHNESIRLYEFNDFVERQTKPITTIEGLEQEAVPETIQYAICYGTDYSLIYENGAAEKGIFAQIEQYDPISNIDFAKEEVIVFVGSSDVKQETDCYLVTNLVLYNGVISEDELDLLQ